MPVALLIDASPLIYSNYNAMRKFTTKSGEPTGLRFGFMRSVNSYAKKLKADRIAICFDLPGPVKKAEGLEGYKANRTFTPDKAEMYSQVPDLKKMISCTRYAQVQAEGYEADDVIASLARKLATSGHHVYIVSPDNDLLQLVGKNIEIWMPPKKGEKPWLKGEEYCHAMFGVAPNLLLVHRVMCGDSSDNIAGVAKLRGNKAWVNNYLKSISTVRGIDPTSPVEEVLSAIKSSSLVKGLEEQNPSWEGSFVMNYRAMQLHNPPELEIEKGSKDAAALTKMFLDLEMNSMIAQVPYFVGTAALGMPIERI